MAFAICEVVRPRKTPRPTPAIALTVLRLVLLATLCAGLQGCVYTMSANHSTTLPQVPAGREAVKLPVPVAFVVYGLCNPATYADDAPDFENKLEAKSWLKVLSRYAARENIFVGDSVTWIGLPLPIDISRNAGAEAFLEAHRGLPLVRITLSRKPGALPLLENIGARAVNFSSVGLIPVPSPTPVLAQFALSMPGDMDTQSQKLDYTYRREEYLTPLFILNPGFADETSYLGAIPYLGIGIIGHTESGDWRAEEKRRLLAQFLQDVMPQLREYEQKQTSASVKPE